MRLNGTDDDRKAFKMKLREESGILGNESDKINSNYNSAYTGLHNKSSKKQEPSSFGQGIEENSV